MNKKVLYFIFTAYIGAIAFAIGLHNLFATIALVLSCFLVAILMSCINDACEMLDHQSKAIHDLNKYARKQSELISKMRDSVIEANVLLNKKIKEHEKGNKQGNTSSL